MSRKTVVTPPDDAKPGGHWSPAISMPAGRMVFVSGMTARAPDGSVVGEGDIAAQTRRVCERVQAAVEAAGGTLDDIAQVIVYVMDVGDFDTIHAIRREFFESEPPASTMVQVARLVDPRCLIEISAIAVLPE